MSSMRPQVWVHEERPTPEQVEPIAPTDDRALRKKPRGGLWTSPLREDGTSAWIEWMQAEHFSVVPNPRAWKLTVADDASVYTIDDVADLRAIVTDPPRRERYGALRDTGRCKVIDWRAVFAEYDGIHLTREGQISTRFTDRGEPDLYGWDCECVLWDDWHFTDVEYMGPVELTTPSYQR